MPVVPAAAVVVAIGTLRTVVPMFAVIAAISAFFGCGKMQAAITGLPFMIVIC
jgi:hypothetical protein